MVEKSVFKQVLDLFNPDSNINIESSGTVGGLVLLLVIFILAGIAGSFIYG